MTEPRPAPPGPGALARVVHLWFGFRAPVGRRAYVASGVGLMALKYGADALLVYLTMHVFWSPFSYINPLCRCTRRPTGRCGRTG